MKTVDTQGPRIESLLRSLTTRLYVFSVGSCKETSGFWLMWGGSAGGAGGALGRSLSCCLGLQEQVKTSFVEPVLRVSIYVIPYKKEREWFSTVIVLKNHG